MEDLGIPRSSIERSPALPFPCRRHRRVPGRARRGAVEPARAAAGAVAAVQGRPARAADRPRRRPGVRRARRSRRRVPADRPRRVARRGDGVVQGQDDRADAGSGARVGRRAASSRCRRRRRATGAAGSCRSSSSAARSSLIYDTRLDLRKPSRLLVVGDLRVPRIAVRYDSLGASRAADHRRDAARERHGHAGRRTPDDQVRRRRARRAEPAAAPVQLARGSSWRSASSTPTTMAVDLGPRFAGFSATTQPVDTTMRLVIDLVAAQTDAPAAAAPRAAAAAPPPDLPPAFGQPASALPHDRHRSRPRRRRRRREERRRREGKGSDAGHRAAPQGGHRRRASASASC